MFFTNNHHLYDTPSHLKFYKSFASDFFPCDNDDNDDVKVSQYQPIVRMHKDDDEEVELVMDLPGVKPTDLDVQVKDRILSVSGKRFLSNTKTLKFSRQFQLDTNNIDPSTVKANLVDGVLTITVQKMKKLDSSMKIAVTTNPTIHVAAAVEEEEKKEDVEN